MKRMTLGGVVRTHNRCMNGLWDFDFGFFYNIFSYDNLAGLDGVKYHEFWF